MNYFIRDSRFSPLTQTELNSLSICVSLLVTYEPATNYLDWDVNIHGGLTATFYSPHDINLLTISLYCSQR